MTPQVAPDKIREQIADLLWEHTSAYETEEVCDRLGMPPILDGTVAMSSKRVYVRKRLQRAPLPELLDIAQRVVDEYHDGKLEQLLDGDGLRGVAGELQNVIFAAVGPKPRIVLRDAINNVIEIIEGAERCLVYDRPLPANGLDWGTLVDWWREDTGTTGREAALSLYHRLSKALASPPEKLLFRTYCRRYANDTRDVPALLPQVYMHYDPFTKRELGSEGDELPRQRMDFLLLPTNRARIVIEVDGKQHYADESGRASPQRYAEMVREDRAIRLDGYEVYRFGGKELFGEAGEALVDAFFDRLLDRHTQ
ncbi:MAG TPA: hypothetical protein VGP17_13630 [Solirubrobacteraceae bacterium]|jgi:hypothetical protein|nr:hypothetical protein [Solirubrobacteraceae bacterium]